VSRKIRFSACQTFGSAFDMGMVQAGFELVHKVEREGGFGTRNAEVNRHLLGHDWRAQAGNFADWEVVHSDVVVGNPPCSCPGSHSCHVLTSVA
jgi:hypothetical protein